MNNQTTILYRPVGPKELALIATSGYREFPPRSIEVIAKYEHESAT